jgi:hypothetical protein
VPKLGHEQTSNQLPGEWNARPSHRFSGLGELNLADTGFHNQPESRLTHRRGDASNSLGENLNGRNSFGGIQANVDEVFGACDSFRIRPRHHRRVEVVDSRKAGRAHQLLE